MTLRRRHPEDDAFAAFAQDVRAAVDSPPHEETARRHLAAMRAAAEGSASQHDAGAPASGAGVANRVGRRRSAGPLRPLFRLGAVTAGALAAFTGASSALAAAGVELPAPVRAPFEAVGIELPNQPSDDDERDGGTPDRDERQPGAPGADERETRGGETGRDRSGGRGEQGRDRARQGGDGAKGRARGRDGTQPGKDGTRGDSERHRRDDSAPNSSRSKADRPARQRTRPERPASRRATPRRGRSDDAKRARPERPRPTGPKPRVEAAPTQPPPSGREKATIVTPPATTTETDTQTP